MIYGTERIYIFTNNLSFLTVSNPCLSAVLKSCYQTEISLIISLEDLKLSTDILFLFANF